MSNTLKVNDSTHYVKIINSWAKKYMNMILSDQIEYDLIRIYDNCDEEDSSDLYFEWYYGFKGEDYEDARDKTRQLIEWLEEIDNSAEVE